MKAPSLSTFCLGRENAPESLPKASPLLGAPLRRVSFFQTLQKQPPFFGGAKAPKMPASAFFSPGCCVGMDFSNRRLCKYAASRCIGGLIGARVFTPTENAVFAPVATFSPFCGSRNNAPAGPSRAIPRTSGTVSRRNSFFSQAGARRTIYHLSHARVAARQGKEHAVDARPRFSRRHRAEGRMHAANVQPCFPQREIFESASGEAETQRRWSASTTQPKIP